MTILVTTNIAPKNDNKFYLVEDTYLKGGFRVCEDSVERDTIDPLSRKAGMIVVLSTDNSQWKLESDLVTWTPVKVLGGSIIQDASNRLVTDGEKALWYAKVQTVNGRAGNVTLTKEDFNLDLIDNTSDLDKPVSTAQALADTNIQTAAAADATAKANAAKTYAESLVVGLWDDRGNFNASINTFPTAGGSGISEAILKGDIWTVSTVATNGPLNGFATGTVVRALVDAPGQTTTNWSIIAGTVSVTLGTPWDINGSCFDKPAASQVDIRFTTARAFTIPANLAGSIITVGTAATASSVFLIQKNAVTVATVTIAAGTTTATLSSQAAIAFAIGDKFKIVAPTTPDATLADIDFTIVAYLAS